MKEIKSVIVIVKRKCLTSFLSIFLTVSKRKIFEKIDAPKINTTRTKKVLSVISDKKGEEYGANIKTAANNRYLKISTILFVFKFNPFFL